LHDTLDIHFFSLTETHGSCALRGDSSGRRFVAAYLADLLFAARHRRDGIKIAAPLRT
jgi:hypothetical protein